jgi:hypothetical protein
MYIFQRALPQIKAPIYGAESALIKGSFNNKYHVFSALIPLIHIPREVAYLHSQIKYPDYNNIIRLTNVDGP